MIRPHFFCLAPHLKNESGHLCAYLQCVERAVRQQVASFKLFMLSNADLPHCPKNWISHFNHKHKWFGKSYRSILKNEGKDAERRIFLCEQFSFINALHFIFAFLFWSRPSDEYWLILRHDFDSLKFRGIVRQAIYRFLHRKINNRLKLITDSFLLQLELGKRLRLPLHVLPLPHTTLPMEIQQKTHSVDRIRCYWAGPPRLTKGWEDIRYILTLRSPTETIEMVASQEAGLTSSTIQTIALPSVLKHQQYWQELINCDVLLFPYHPVLYRYSTSGIFVEGVIAGKIPVVRDDTWMASELRRFDLQELIVDWRDRNFWQNIVRLSKDFDVTHKLVLMRQEYQTFHSEKNFAACLTKLF